MSHQGIYFLANDHVFELVVAFLNSFREKNKTIDLCLIPFDKNFEKIRSLQYEYNFSVFENEEILVACDKISTNFHSSTLGAYRKIAAWHGKFDEFAYIDVDTIVLQNIDFVFDCLKYSPIFTSHSNIPSIRKWVWKDTIYGKNILTESQINFSANTGFFVSIKNLLPIKWIIDQVSTAISIKNDMELHCMEQPFLNYLIVSSGHNFSSLSVMADLKIPEARFLECWAGTEGGIVLNGDFHIPGNPDYFLLHWAGLWQASLDHIPYKNLWLYYRNLNAENLIMNQSNVTQIALDARE